MSVARSAPVVVVTIAAAVVDATAAVAAASVAAVIAANLFVVAFLSGKRDALAKQSLSQNYSQLLPLLLFSLLLLLLLLLLLSNRKLKNIKTILRFILFTGHIKTLPTVVRTAFAEDPQLVHPSPPSSSCLLLTQRIMT